MSYITELDTSCVDYCKRIAEQLSKNSNLFDDIEQKVWRVAREYDTMPSDTEFINFYANVVYEELENQILERIKNMDLSVDIRYELGRESKFYINDDRIFDLKDVERAIAEAIKNANEEETEVDDYSAIEEIRAELESRKEQKDRRLR
ncbi:TPA: hypothetical protein RPV63_001533 [Campylobacter fetus subsp. venerealis]|nr:hypothetical protein [Campylobacter fetus subsp. venerealis]HDX6253972.1 hypothetical protein [Campylobacter fetus subsp. venerealis]HDX6258160.1 hypothetical protein [Campylobacter fetus subsp. venerealis]HDX6261819.1 hypothetical protein [Campylobacter fetus subsp. venerealis]HDX6263949.1 hypothetical protein [Campylobacter fetus subsp. venerealis]